MERLKQRKEQYSKAIKRLEEGLQKRESPIIIDGVLYRFKFAFELGWKALKDYLEYMGIIEKTGSPREVIQSGFKQGIIEDGEAWIKMMLSRNMLAHLYDEEESRKIYKLIKEQYVVLLEELDEKFKQLL